MKLNLKKKTILTLLPAMLTASITIVPQFALAIEDTATQNIEQVEQQTITRFVMSGSIPANEHYSIRDNRNKIIAKGQADNNGIFFATVDRKSLTKSKSLTLRHNHQSITKEISSDDYAIVFSVAEAPMSGLLMSSGFDAESITTISVLLTMAAISVGIPAVGALIFPVSLIIGGIFSLFAPPTEDLITPRLDKIIEMMSDVQTQVESGFKTTNQRFSDVFGSMINQSILDSLVKGNTLTSQFKVINNALASSTYSDFWEQHPEYKELANMDTDQNLTNEDREALWNKQPNFWSDLKEYDKEKGINTEFDSITSILKDIYMILNDSSYNLSTPKYKADELYDAARKIQIQQQLREALEAKNNATIDVDLHGDSANIGSICNGDEKNIIMLGYANTLLNIANIKSLNSILVNFGYPTQYQSREDLEVVFFNELTDLVDTTKSSLNNCNFFNSTGSGWPDITYVTVTKDAKPYLAVMAPLKNFYQVPADADDLAFNKDNALRKEFFSTQQNMFFDTLLANYWNESEQKNIGFNSEYTNGNNELIAYYALNSTTDIKNSDLIQEFGSKAAIDDVQCKYNTCTFHISDVKSDSYSLYFSDGEEVKLQSGNNTITHRFPMDIEWHKDTILNIYALLINDKKETIERKNIAIEDLPYTKTPEYLVTNIHFDKGERYQNIYTYFDNPNYTVSKENSSIVQMSPSESTRVAKYANNNGAQFDLVSGGITTDVHLHIAFENSEIKQTSDFECKVKIGTHISGSNIDILSCSQKWLPPILKI